MSTIGEKLQIALLLRGKAESVELLLDLKPYASLDDKR